MSVLSFTKPAKRRPGMITILGDAGMGKTSLACTFPSPAIIRTEGENIPFDIDANSVLVTEPVRDSDALFDTLREIMKGNSTGIETLVIDSVTGLERMFEREIIESDPKNPKGINQALGGYGNGPAAVAAKHVLFRSACATLSERLGINIVFIAHAQTETIELPDQDPYTRYNLRLGKKSVAPYTDEVDCVGYIKLVTATVGSGDRKKAMSTGERQLITYATAANVSKNRYGISEPLTLVPGQNPLAKFITTPTNAKGA